MSIEEEGEREGNETLYLWRVQMLGCVEVAGYSREEAMYQALGALTKASKELLRPFRVEKLGVLDRSELSEEEEGEREEEGEEKGEKTASLKASLEAGGVDVNDSLLKAGGMFEADEGAKERWKKELTEKITAEVTERMARGEGAKPIPIPLK